MAKSSGRKAQAITQYSSSPGQLVAGLDEAGRGCLAGPVVAAAVVLPARCRIKGLRDSKKLSPKRREELKEKIIDTAVDWCVSIVDEKTIDRMNILWASVFAMHNCIDFLALKPNLLLVDGNRFKPYVGIPHQCVVKGDDKYLSIAAASILAKTVRDDYMIGLDTKHPVYQWKNNKGYPTKAHKLAILEHGITGYHRRSYKPCMIDGTRK